MYSQMVLRNKRFKPSFPLREPISAPEQAPEEEEPESADDSDREVKAVDHLDVLAV